MAAVTGFHTYIHTGPYRLLAVLWSPTGWWLQHNSGPHFSVWTSCAVLAYRLKPFKLSSFLGEPWAASFILLLCPRFYSKPAKWRTLSNKKASTTRILFKGRTAGPAFRSYKVNCLSSNRNDLYAAVPNLWGGTPQMGRNVHLRGHKKTYSSAWKCLFFRLFILFSYEILTLILPQTTWEG